LLSKIKSDKTVFTFFNTRYLNEEVNRTEPSLSVSVPWCHSTVAQRPHTYLSLFTKAFKNLGWNSKNFSRTSYHHFQTVVFYLDSSQSRFKVNTLKLRRCHHNSYRKTFVIRLVNLIPCSSIEATAKATKHDLVSQFFSLLKLH
jgi:hypothetical protein